MKQDLDVQSALVAEVAVCPPHETAPDVESRRQLLFSARMRFSSETQCLRRQAIDHIIEQNLALSDEDAGLSVNDIQNRRVVALPDGAAVLDRAELESGLKRLVAAGRAVASQSEPQKYKVTDGVRTEIWQLQNECEQRLATIVGRLFRGAKEGASIYCKPFMECLCYVFAKLGEAYV